MNYKEILERAQSMPVVMERVDVEEGHEVDRLWLADMVDGKWVEDYVVVRRDIYDTVTDEEGAVFALIENGKMLVKAPNVKHYRIPESVDRLAENAFRDCTDLKELDVPYNICGYELGVALSKCKKRPKAKVWYWSYNNERNKELIKEIQDGRTDECGFVYSQDRKRLLKASTVKSYWIPEGIEQIDRLAFVGCTFEELHVPYTCKLEDLPEEQYPIFGNERVQGCVMIWDRPYSQEDDIPDSLYRTNDDKHVDKKGVYYTANMKRLLNSSIHFDETEYHVPDGVETICSHAFSFSKQFLTLSVPSSIRVIGDNLFGNEGGKIVVRKETQSDSPA